MQIYVLHNTVVACGLNSEVLLGGVIQDAPLLIIICFPRDKIKTAYKFSLP